MLTKERLGRLVLSDGFKVKNSASSCQFDLGSTVKVVPICAKYQLSDSRRLDFVLLYVVDLSQFAAYHTPDRLKEFVENRRAEVLLDTSGNIRSTMRSHYCLHENSMLNYMSDFYTRREVEGP